MEQVLTVINTLFSSATDITPQKRKEADEWLRAFQKTVCVND
jgi:hypothetical protein